MGLEKKNSETFYSYSSCFEQNLSDGPQFGPGGRAAILHRLRQNETACNPEGGGGLLPYMDYIGMCGPKG